MAVSRSLWLHVDEDGRPVMLCLGTGLSEEVVGVVRQALEESQAEAAGSGRAKEVYVEDIYDQELYGQHRRPDVSPVEPGKVFASATAASWHLGLPSKTVANALNYAQKRDLKHWDTFVKVLEVAHDPEKKYASGYYPIDIAKVGGLVLRWYSKHLKI
jgi:hypothetical protein